MSLYDVESFLFRLKTDPNVKKELAENAERHLSKQPFEADERAALLNKDLVAVWNMGVHPLLLVPYAQAMNVPPPEYKRVMAALAGKRKFVS